MKLVSEVNLWQVKSSNICSRSSLKRSQDMNDNAISTRWISIAKVSQTLCYAFPKHVSDKYCLFVWFVRRREVYLKVTNTSLHNVVRHIHVSMVSFLHGLYCYYTISAYSFHDYLSLCGQLAGEISLQLSLKRFPSLGLQTNGNESNAILSRFRPNRKLTWTIYHWSVILRSFSVVSNLIFGQAQCKRIFQGSVTLFVSFEFATSCQKIKVWYMRSYGILFL